ncbi:MAG: nucleoside hydrolase [bacterium]|nr:nucleoside hydrolase [bacterium]
MKSYTVVTDPGIDDTVALVLLWRLASDVSHTLVSTFGNVPEHHTADTIAKFIARIAPHWSWMHGATEPIQPLEHSWPTYFHGEDGLWGVKPAAAIGVEHNPHSEIYKDVISLGPMTSVWNIAQKYSLRSLVVMGGAFSVLGNETQYAETNIAFDSDAAAAVFGMKNEMPITTIPLDVTKKIYWTKHDVMRIPESTLWGRWVKKFLLIWFEKYGDPHGVPFDLHDPVAVYAAVFPDAFVWLHANVTIITKGKERGRTQAGSINESSKIALGVKNAKKVAKDIFSLCFEI